MEPQEIVTRTTKNWLADDGILRATYLPGVEEVLEDAKQNVAVSTKITKGQPRPLLLDCQEIGSQSRDARTYYTTAKPENFLAVAILINSPMSRMIGNLVLGFNRGPYPTRLFTSEAEAIAWLKGFLA